MKKEITVAANITYSGLTYNTKLHLEYKHTGKQYFKGKSHSTSSEEIANEWKVKGKKVTIKEGHYFINRMAIPTINAKGESVLWYIDNEGDTYMVNKVSKYGIKIHNELSKEQAFIN